MDYRKLFQVLVVGGAMVGGATSCNEKTASAGERPKGASAGDAGTADAGQGGGGGVQGW